MGAEHVRVPSDSTKDATQRAILISVISNHFFELVLKITEMGMLSMRARGYSFCRDKIRIKVYNTALVLLKFLDEKLMKSLKSKKVFRILLALLLLGSLNFAQSEDDSKRVTIKLYQNLDKLPLNSQLKIAVKVKIEDGWHINSDTPNDEFLIPTSFELLSERNFEITKIKYPDPLILDLSFSDEPVSVFEGEFFIGAIIEIPENLELGNHQIPVELYYQACNDQTCEPPQAVKSTLEISVVNSNTPVTEINKDIFAKLKLSK